MSLLATGQHRAVSFDVDGTLYDFKRHRVHLLPSLLASPRLLLTYREVVAGLRGEVHEDLHAELCRRVGARVGLPEEIVNQRLNRSVYGAWPASFRPRTALRDLPLLLRILDDAQVPRLVISDHPAWAKLENMGLGEGWAAVIDSEAVGAFKPHPRPIERAAEALGLSPDQILHVGDREDTDGAMAEAVGATCLIRGRDWDSIDQLGRLLMGKPWPELRSAHGG
ncbi:MAG: HAD family hydrolase [Alphaproteobacteria bacterium]|nr:HAD family hydrolase [Alphaproteobacteria bacterium]MCB9794389.1 HAD family hydrolase [Alphaproteobacteria bacterium]